MEGKPVDIRKFTGEDRFGQKDPEYLLCRLKKLTYDIRTKGIRVQGGREVVTGYCYGELFDWDLYFESVFLAYLGVFRFCRNSVEMFLDAQQPSGFIPRTMGIVYPKPRHHFKPFLAQAALLCSRQSLDFRWLRGKYYERLKRYLNYWFRYCDADKNGLCFWDGSDHSGMDNQELRLGYDGVMEFEGVDLNCYLVRELSAMSELAAELGFPEDAADFARGSSGLTRRIDEVFWDERDGFYYDRSERTGKKKRLLTVAGLLPLWLDGVPQGRIQRLVREHLTNPEEFWTPYPVATWAKSSPGYYQQRRANECNWCGPTWIPTNYMLFHGLCRHGFLPEAKLLAEKTYELVVSESETCEYYNGETGAGQGLNPFWGWSSLGFLMKMEYETGYDPTDLSRKDFWTLEDVTL